jgi:anti-sigma factor RsiW
MGHLPDACHACEEAIVDRLDGALSAEQLAAFEAHIAICGRCRALLREIETLRVRAAALPVLEPTRDLWSGIEQRISAGRGDGPWTRVEEHRAPALERARHRWWGRSGSTRSVRIAAAMLILVGGVTYAVVRQESPKATNGSTPTAVAVTAAPTGSAPAGTTPGVVTGHEPTLPTTPAAAATSAGTPGARPRFVRNERRSPDDIYDGQIAQLRQILAERRSQLDSQTVAVIEHNLAVIDTAIAQSRAALARNPRNQFLVEQLDHVLDTKVELLRTVALLPSHT